MKKAHEFDEKNFLQDSKGAILYPEEIPSVVHAQVALRMVEAAHRIFKEWNLFFVSLNKLQLSFYRQKLFYPFTRRWNIAIMEYPSGQKDHYLNHADLDSIQKDIEEYDHITSMIRSKIEKRLVVLNPESRNLSNSEIGYMHTNFPSVAALPDEAHSSYLRHQLILKSFETSHPILRWFKVWIYNMYFMDDVGIARYPYLKTRPSQLLMVSWILLLVACVVLLGCLSYIIIFASSLEDELVVRSILLSIASAVLFEVLIGGPIRKLCHAGIFPAIASFFVATDIKGEYSLGAVGKNISTKIVLANQDVFNPVTVDPASMMKDNVSVLLEDKEGQGDDIDEADSEQLEGVGKKEDTIMISEEVIESSKNSMVVESVTILDITEDQGTLDLPFQGRPLDLMSWAGPNYLVFNIACCHQTYMMMICSSDNIEPPMTLVDSLKHRVDLRRELMHYYSVDVEGVKALMNRVTYGCNTHGWKIQFGVEMQTDHPFIVQFYDDMRNVCTKIRSPPQYNHNGEPVDHRRHNTPLYVRANHLQSQLLRSLKFRLVQRWSFDPDLSIEMFDAVLVTRQNKFNLHKDVKTSERKYTDILNDLVDHIEERHNCWIALTLHLPRGRELASTRDFEILEGTPEDIKMIVPRGHEYLDLDISTSLFTCLTILLQSFDIQPPNSLILLINNQSQLRVDLSSHYNCSIIAIKALLNRLCDGGLVQAWRVDFGVAESEDHKFILTLQEDLKTLAGLMQAQATNFLGARHLKESSYSFKSWLPSLNYIQQQILDSVLSHLENKHSYDITKTIRLFDGVALTNEMPTNMESLHGKFACQMLLNDIVDHLRRTCNISVGLSFKFLSKTISSNDELQLARGPANGIKVRPERSLVSKPKKHKNKKNISMIDDNINNGEIVKSSYGNEVEELLESDYEERLFSGSDSERSREIAARRIQATLRGMLARKMRQAKMIEKIEIKESSRETTVQDMRAYSEVSKLLADIGLERYYPIFKEKGMDTFMSLKKLDDVALMNLGVKKFHLMKIRRGVRILS